MLNDPTCVISLLLAYTLTISTNISLIGLLTSPFPPLLSDPLILQQSASTPTPGTSTPTAAASAPETATADAKPDTQPSPAPSQP